MTAGASVPATGAAVKWLRSGRLDTLAVLVMGSAALTMVLSVVSGSPRSLLAREGWVTGAWGIWMCWGAWAARPPTFTIARPLMEGSRFFGTASWSDLWEQSSEFRRIWRVSSVLWGMALLADASIRVLMAYILPVSVVPALAGALYPVTFVVMQLVTNVYFHRAGLYRMLGARWVQ